MSRSTLPTTGGWRDFQQAQGTQDISWAVADIAEIPRVAEALVARDYPERDIDKILGGNFLALCRKVFGS